MAVEKEQFLLDSTIRRHWSMSIEQETVHGPSHVLANASKKEWMRVHAHGWWIVVHLENPCLFIFRLELVPLL